MAKAQKCVHGRTKNGYYCVPCKGKGICEHDKRRTLCAICGGAYLCDCVLPKQRNNCFTCSPEFFCQHALKPTKCLDCDGVSFCEHRKRREVCKECKVLGKGGNGLCDEHHTVKSKCIPCQGASICEHGVQKHVCRECHGNSRCIEHNVEFRHCRICPGGGSAFCQIHGGQKDGQLKAQCKECKR
jgi:hypothetical protein